MTKKEIVLKLFNEEKVGSEMTKCSLFRKLADVHPGFSPATFGRIFSLFIIMTKRVEMIGMTTSGAHISSKDVKRSFCRWVKRMSKLHLLDSGVDLPSRSQLVPIVDTVDTGFRVKLGMVRFF